MKYTSTEWDLVKQSLAVALRNGASAVKGSGVDCSVADELLVELVFGAIASTGTLALKLQESDDDVDANYTDISGATASKTETAAGLTFVARVDLRGRKRWIRAVGTDAAAAVTYGVLFHLMSLRNLPATQVNTVLFSV